MLTGWPIVGGVWVMVGVGLVVLARRTRGRASVPVVVREQAWREDEVPAEDEVPG